MRFLNEIEEYLEFHHKEIRAISPHILNVGYGKKITGGKLTDEDCIRIYVDKKIEKIKLKIEEIIPEFYGKYKTDVIEIKADGWKAGKTAISELSPREQRLKLGLKEKKQVNNEHKLEQSNNYEIDWRKSGKLIPVRNQEDCGSCVAFSVTNTWSDNISILENQTVILSPQQIFFCSGGTCEDGEVPEDALNFGVNTGCALEKDCPYVSGNGKDEPCGYDLNPDWDLRGKVLESWQAIYSTLDMKKNLSVAPLETTMNVQQSFMNYTGGVYKGGNLDEDPIVGGHAIEAVGCSDSGGYWICKNQWGEDWGENGYFRIAYGEDGIDSEMYKVTLSKLTPRQLRAKGCINYFQGMIDSINSGDFSAILGELGAGIECLINTGVMNKIDILRRL